MGFQIKPILKAPPIGNWLRREREGRGWTLEKASRETKIQKKYLALIEDERYDALPDGIVKRNFVRSYIQTLGGGPELTLYAERLVAPSIAGTNVAVHPPIGIRSALTPEHLKIAGLVVGALGLAIYLALQISALLAPPFLTVTTPIEGYVTHVPTVTVAGTTDNKAMIRVGEKEVPKDAEGAFHGTVDLRHGTNFIKIESKRKHSRPRVEYRTILFE